MRPRLSVLSEDLLDRILDEAMRILAETGMEIRGPEMRRRLLEAGLPTNAAGDRVLFPREFVERADADPSSRAARTALSFSDKSRASFSISMILAMG